MIVAIVPTEPVLHSKLLTRLEVTDVDLQPPLKIVPVNTFGPAMTQLLCHAPAGKGQPCTVEPDATFVLPGHPNHDRCRVHYLAKSFIEVARVLKWDGTSAGLSHFLSQIIDRFTGSLTNERVCRPKLTNHGSGLKLTCIGV